MAAEARSVRIDVWSDVVCPFCYIGKRKLELALAETGVDARVRWHSFELDPAAPRATGPALPDLLAAKYGLSQAAAVRMLEQQQQAAADVGLTYNWRTANRGNTFDAHRLIQFAESRGQAGDLAERLFRGYFVEGTPIWDSGALRRLALEVGLDADAVDAVLRSDAFAADVRDDERRAGELGIHAVPHFVVNGRSVISGARDVAHFITVLAAESVSPPLGRL
ncbi:MAG TPA: DsbA family oxidoreductase [Mycobacterium sp.]|nr:DsbA family oxidoreductase [Mycobacterium sp.]